MSTTASLSKSSPRQSALLGFLATVARSRLTGVMLLVLLLAFWELSAIFKMVEAVIWPSFSSIILAWLRLLAGGDLFLALLPSLKRMALGYVGAVAAGISLGLAMGYFRSVYNLLEVVIESIRPIPSPAYIPIVILFLGIDDEMKVFMIVLASFFPVLLNTINGVRNADPVLIDTGRTLGLSTRKIVQKIIFPAATPYIFTGMRVSLALALVLMVISEMVAGNSGMGFFILDTQRSFRVREMYAGVITLAILGYLLNRLFLWSESRILAWNLGYTKTRPL